MKDQDARQCISLLTTCINLIPKAMKNYRGLLWDPKYLLRSREKVIKKFRNVWQTGILKEGIWYSVALLYFLAQKEVYLAKPESSNKQHLIKSGVMLIAIKIAREQAWPLLNYVGSVSFFFSFLVKWSIIIVCLILGLQTDEIFIFWVTRATVCRKSDS